MANGIKTRQNKLRKIGYTLETSAGTYEAPTGGTLILPAENISVAFDRGTRIVSRAGVNDGFAGSVAGVSGTFGATVSFDMEVHDPGAGIQYPYFFDILTACGMTVSGSSTTVANCYPSTRKVSNYSAPSADTQYGPHLTSLTYIENNNGTEDTRIPLKAGAGTWTLNLTEGERALFGLNFHASPNTGSFIATDDVDYAQNFVTSSTGVSGSPLTVKNITCELSGSGGISDILLSQVTIDSGFNLSETPDPCEQFGFGPSNVFQDDAPTISFALAENDSTDEVVWQRFAKGQTFSLYLEFEFGSGALFAIDIPTMQFDNVAYGNVNGYTTYQISARCVRAYGQNEDQSYPIQFSWKGTT